MTSVTSRDLEKAFQEDNNAEVTVIKGNRHYYVSFQGTTHLHICFRYSYYFTLYFTYICKYLTVLFLQICIRETPNTTQRGGCAGDHALCLSVRWRLKLPSDRTHKHTLFMYMSTDIQIMSYFLRFVSLFNSHIHT